MSRKEEIEARKLELRNEIEDAINEFNTALRFKNDDYESMRKLANLHEKNNELDIAIDYYHTLWEAKIDYINTTKKITNIYIKKNDFQMAQNYIEDALKESDDIELKFLNGKCMYKLKDYESAIEVLEYYKENTKSLANIDETNKMIKDIEEKKSGSYNPLAKLFKIFS